MNEIKQVTYVNGENVADLTADELISTIAQTEADITALQGVNTESSAITAKIAKLEKFATNIAKLLDSKKAS